MNQLPLCNSLREYNQPLAIPSSDGVAIKKSKVKQLLPKPISKINYDVEVYMDWKQSIQSQARTSNSKEKWAEQELVVRKLFNRIISRTFSFRQ